MATPTPKALIHEHRDFIRRVARKAARLTGTQYNDEDVVQHAMMSVLVGLNRPSTNLNDPKIKGLISTIAYSQTIRNAEKLRNGLTIRNQYFKHHEELPELVWMDSEAFDKDKLTLLSLASGSPKVLWDIGVSFQNHAPLELQILIDQTEFTDVQRRTLDQLVEGMTPKQMQERESASPPAISQRIRSVVEKLRGVATGELF